MKGRSKGQVVKMEKSSFTAPRKRIVAKEMREMIGPTNSIEMMVREGFTLLLDLRRHPEAQRLIPLAVAFLETLLGQVAHDAPPFVVSVKAMKLRRH